MTLRVLTSHLRIEHQTLVGTSVAAPVVGHVKRVNLRTHDDGTFSIEILDVLVELRLGSAGHHYARTIMRILRLIFAISCGNALVGILIALTACLVVLLYHLRD